MHITCVNSKDNAKSNDSDHIFVIRENTRLKHRCPLCIMRRFSMAVCCNVAPRYHTHRCHLSNLKIKQSTNIDVIRNHQMGSEYWRDTHLE